LELPGADLLLAHAGSVRAALTLIAVVGVVVAVVVLLRSGSSAVATARRLARRGDHHGAGECYLRNGHPRKALAELRKARAWADAAQAAFALERKEEAAALLARAGGRKLEEAAKTYRALGLPEQSASCFGRLADWCQSEGHLNEAIEAWGHAGQHLRAVKLAAMSLRKGLLTPGSSAFTVARRAAENTDSLELLAQLNELDSAWIEAAEAWRRLGIWTRAAKCSLRADRLEDASADLERAGQLMEAAKLSIQRHRQLREQTESSASVEAGEGAADKLAAYTDTLVRRLHGLGMLTEASEVLCSVDRQREAIDLLLASDRPGEAAEIATQEQLWDVAGPLLERLHRWGEASDVYELDGRLDEAARCAEKAGEHTRAAELFASSGNPVAHAWSLARGGHLQQALIELHRHDMLPTAIEVLNATPGPIPDIPDVVLDIVHVLQKQGNPTLAISVLQRAVVGIALTNLRLQPALALASLLHQSNAHHQALEQLDRILAFDYAFTPAHELKEKIVRELPAQTVATPNGEPSTPLALSDAGTGPPREGVSAEQRYEIVTELGRGGMGVVFQAIDTRLERDVAIKVLRTSSAREAGRLEREAKAAALLNHPGIITIHDFSEGFDGFFIVMEFARGLGLDKVLKDDPERIRSQLVAIMRSLADAVAYAHRHEVIHRDLKPANVLLTDDDQVKILDFGIAERLEWVRRDGAAVCGTPFYMAPEQIRGETPSIASDIYSLGATFYHLATGRPPFARGNVIDAHLHRPPQDPVELVPSLPQEVGRVILRCLEKDPKQRYPNASEINLDLPHLRP
jgi:tetratricopeptide (TPR) repeat protein